VTDLDALRAAVQQSPHDWTPRLVLADYLDDTGEPHHAEEAARIRQAADPSTPLGRAVAASRRAFGTTLKNPTNPLYPAHAKGAATRGEKLIHTLIHGPNLAARGSAAYDLIAVHDRHIVNHNRAADALPPVDGLHTVAAGHHGEAGMWLHQYARNMR
jgi:uncharacterized protein (TIGR02996 family)